MPRCYLLAVMRGSSLDTSSNNWTLFSLIEQLRIPKFPAVLPLEIHTYWQFAPDELIPWCSQGISCLAGSRGGYSTILGRLSVRNWARA